MIIAGLQQERCHARFCILPPMDNILRKTPCALTMFADQINALTAYHRRVGIASRKECLGTIQKDGLMKTASSQNFLLNHEASTKMNQKIFVSHDWTQFLPDITQSKQQFVTKYYSLFKAYNVSAKERNHHLPLYRIAFTSHWNQRRRPFQFAPQRHHVISKGQRFVAKSHSRQQNRFHIILFYSQLLLLLRQNRYNHKMSSHTDTVFYSQDCTDKTYLLHKWFETHVIFRQ